MTDRYAVFGNPIAHSKSPAIHQAFAAQTGQDMSYEAFSAPLNGFADAARDFFDAGGLGINITIPFKVDAYEMADERREGAALTGAANCLAVIDGRIVAENFDGIGLLRDIEVNLNTPLAGKRVLIAGAGGAARGAALPLAQAGVSELVIANRSVGKARAIAERLSAHGPITGCAYDDVSGGFDVIINATSTGLSGHRLPLPDSAFEGVTLAYDMVYGKGLTPFLAAARDLGVAQVVDGAGMLVEQAAEAFLWWRGVRPETPPVIKAIEVPLD